MTVTGALLSFALVAGLLTLVPGIDTALIVRTVLTRGRSTAFGTALGVTTGVMVWGVAAATGAAALLAASELAYRLLTLAGAGYMAYLGGALLVRTFRPPAAVRAGQAVQPAPSPLRAFLTGLGTNLLNPKVGVFYLATIPQFVPARTAPLVMGVLLAGVHCALTVLWFAVLILGGGAVARFLRSERASTVVDRITGVVLIGFGVRLALHPR